MSESDDEVTVSKYARRDDAWFNMDETADVNLNKGERLWVLIGLFKLRAEYKEEERHVFYDEPYDDSAMIDTGKKIQHLDNLIRKFI